ncbi:hypothetical protein CU098_008102 [Rhizopus stolonifer]|uniref:Xylanolytic transcriptional activator regulatory domain-containing protein n=1 Tax=Rhizopus stolonifer TaxID=4846 RepID=A0A367KY57_RHIST|nr:hypothetical protein CU098_008102 [Rhizopus stolonifer]
MQCKAREIACSLYKDGTLETDDTVDSIPVSATKENNVFFSETIDETHTKLKRKGPLLESRVSNMLACLGDVLKKTVDGAKLSERLWPPAGSFGNFIRWSPEPALPSRYSGSIEMPSADIQMALIDSFFKTRHRALQCILPSFFDQQLKSQGTFITPLLLNAIYALSARFKDIAECPKSDVFFYRAKRLIEDFMDVPRQSTIVALYLLSLYEPSPLIYRPGPYHCRHWIFSGMAFRMCIELGLYDESDVDQTLSAVEIEQRRRIFWACYSLDKYQSGGWERPCMMRSTFIRTRLPSLLPGEVESGDDFQVFLQKTKLSMLVERDLEIKNQTMSVNPVEINESHTIYTHLFNSYVEFFYSLPSNLKWMSDINTPIESVLQLPKPSSTQAQFHLYFHILLIETLIKMPVNECCQLQMRISAAAITQLSHYLCEQPSDIIKLDAVTHALIHAIKVHMLYLEDPDIVIVQQAWLLFYRCIYCLEILNKHAVIPNCHKFLQQLLHIYGVDPFGHQPIPEDDGQDSLLYDFF